MGLILHIVPESDWDDDADEYRPPSLDEEGFIHCSKPEQVEDVANHPANDFPDDSLLVCIDESKVDADIEYEDGFPHIYGPLNTDAVASVVEFPITDEGEFGLPISVAMVEADVIKNSGT
ncbi:DUF952 domain-containing protein [Haloarchaeobius amylolyticus]|uniref:DUF952 domain-containing protein n=1 Tax=Haloarchaeobius amylolyticus TaxID=1198296 RepID=UPI00226E0943|nr:DUF952 domain-containing protein [Haloarchaeobius amylolyticus]